MNKILLGLLTILLICSCGERKETTKTPIRVKTEITGTSTGDCGQSYVGIVEEREATAVSFTNMGVVKWVLVREGQHVSKGQALAKMDSEQARNVLMGATAQMMQANDAFKRYEMLHENGSLPEIQWVEIQSKVEQAKAQLKVAQKNLADCQLIAPVSGIIGKILVKAGETALPSQAVTTILDISSVKVKVAIPEAEISKISANTSFNIYIEAADKQVEGGLVEKGVQADAMTHTYDIRINVANSDRKLLPGMVAKVQYVASPSQETEQAQLLLPITAVQKRSDGSHFVWTVSNDSTAHRTAVSIGKTIGNRIEIIGGLDTGRQVVTEGYQKLSEGTRVMTSE